MAAISLGQLVMSVEPAGCDGGLIGHATCARISAIMEQSVSITLGNCNVCNVQGHANQSIIGTTNSGDLQPPGGHARSTMAKALLLRLTKTLKTI